MKNFIKKHPNFAYFTMTFGWTWILVFALILSGTVEDVSKPTPVFILAGLLCNISPSISAFIVTRISQGKDGVRKLKERFKVKNSMGWYLLAVVIVPSVAMLTILISNFTIRKYEFGIVMPAIIMGLIWPFFSGFGEEFGWRGYILPQFLNRYSTLKAGIILGVIWEVWHLPMHYLGYKNYGIYMIPAIIVIGFINLTLQSVIMAGLFAKSGGNLKLMIIYHATITGSAIISGGFVQAASLPKYTIFEGMVSVSIFFVLVVIMYVKSKRAGVKKEFVPEEFKTINNI